ncbi:MAG TPA: 4,5-DOPA dioxygenase extradiol [Crocinitomicaceae bacterium]|nr:4,5-DOPA dioxygenase extradiol [Crocinitomicaceae bacterium]
MQRDSFLRLMGLSSIGLSISGLSSLIDFSTSLERTDKMPTLFIGHGSPMNAIEKNTFVNRIQQLHSQLPVPKAIICISAHWLTNGTYVTAMENPKTIYDFHGFPKELYEVDYPAPGSPELAASISSIVEDIQIHHDLSWGLDHGTWSILRNIYPSANIPVLQLSIDWKKPLDFHVMLAKKLRMLRERGVLIIGSGNIVHNLGLVDFSKLNQVGYGFDWAIEAREFVNDKILKSDLNSLLKYQNGPNYLKLAIPSPDHYIPLLYVLGLRRNDDELTFFNDELIAGSLSMTSIMLS